MREKSCVSEFGLLFTGRHFWNRKCRKKTWWQQEFAVFKCEATANSVTGHVCVNSNEFGNHVWKYEEARLQFFVRYSKINI